MGDWFSLHTHSHHSMLDGMTTVPQLVEKAIQLGYPALGLSDHGNIGGATRLYKECNKAGILPFVGLETYLIDPTFDGELASPEGTKVQRYHLGLYARNEAGYKALVKLTSMSHTRPKFSGKFARITLDDLTDLSEHAGDDIILTTGCFFGYVQQMLVNEGMVKAQNIIKIYANLFTHTFVEVQNHGIVHNEDADAPCQLNDDQIVLRLRDMADRLGLPMMATQDNHYMDRSEKAAHTLMKTMVYSGADDGFPGDSFHLASEDWVAEHYREDVWQQCLDGAKHMLSLHDLKLPPLDSYRPHVPTVSKTAQQDLHKLCVAELQIHANGRSVKAGKPMSRSTAQQYKDRLDYELDVIDQLGMANYFLHVRKYAAWCRQHNICIEARGSANSSLVCFLVGVTSVDPVKWDLMFERFLSADRIKPPDIDMDVEDSSRERLVQFIMRTYDSERIGTYSELGTTVNDEGEETGSVLVTYKGWQARKDPDNKQLVYARYQNMRDVKRLSPQDYEPLSQMAAMKVYKSYGVHAAGILLSGDDLKISDYVPTMLVASSNTRVTQFDMDDVEEWGLLKDDVLGQTTLRVMRRCQELLGRSNPSDFTWIPDDDPKACAALSEGRTNNGIFHFEGWTKAKGGREMRIKSTKDVVLATALYMPGAMDSGQKDLYIQRRRTPSLRKGIKYLHKAYENALEKTYGAVVYQEQVLQIMRGLGMSIEGVNKFFKIVKDSGAGSAARNAERMKQVRVEFNQLCANNGIKDTDEAWRLTAGMAAYGFNEGHATGYGVRSYRCAYLKTHYPLEFMSALLEAWSGTKKEEFYVKEARRIGILVLPPDVNVSGAYWTIDRSVGGIRRGLMCIKGVGLGAAEDIASNAPYDSVEDLIEHTNGRTVTGGKDYVKKGTLNGVLKALNGAGALKNVTKL